MKEVKSRYKVDMCSLQEVRRISASARLVEGKIPDIVVLGIK